MKKIKDFIGLFVCTVLAIVIISPQICSAGAWTQNKDGAYVRFAFNYYSATKNFNDNGDRKSMAEDGRFRDININSYCEYGLMNNLTLMTSLYYKYLENEDNTIEEESYGISDIDLGLKHKLMDGKMGVVAVQGMVKIPAYDKDDTLPLGNGQYDIEFRVLYGKSLWPKIPGYINGEIGYRFRFEDPSDELRYLFEFGMDFSHKWYSRWKLDGILSMKNADSGASGSDNPSATPEFDLGKLDMVLGYKMTSKWAMEIGFEPDVYGKETSAGTRGTFAVTYKKD